MKAVLTLAVALSLGTILSASASPTKVSEDPALAYRMVRLREPSSAEVEKVINSIPDNYGNSRIIGGSVAAPNQFPYQVGIYTSWSTFASGTVIAPRWVLTTARIVPTGHYDWIEVFGCSLDFHTAPVRGWTTQVFLNSGIGLLKLKDELPYSDCLKPIELATEGCATDSFVNTTAVITGWGSRGSASPVLQNQLWFAEGTAISNEECSTSSVVHDGDICVKPKDNGLGILCTSDGGAPLVSVQTGLQIGVAANTHVGDKCEVGLPSVFVSVPCYLEWIQNILTQNP